MAQVREFSTEDLLAGSVPMAERATVPLAIGTAGAGGAGVAGGVHVSGRRGYGAGAHGLDGGLKDVFTLYCGGGRPGDGSGQH